MASEYELIRAVLADPAAARPRLAYAEWLAADGRDPGRACVIRQAGAGDVEAVAGHTQELGGPGSAAAGPGAVMRLGRSAWRAGYAARLHWSRGFVHEVELPAAAFLAHAADLFAAHPIARVRLTDKLASRPADGAGDYSWRECPPTQVGVLVWRRPGSRRPVTRRASEVAPELFAAGLPRDGFQTAGAADDALSAACVAYGRQLAGQSPRA